MRIPIPGPVKEWLEQLTPRERILVAIAAGFTIIVLIMTLGIRPVVTGANRGQEIISEKQSLLTELAQVAQRLGPQTGGSRTVTAGGTQSLVVVVDRTTRDRGLAPYLKRNQPDGATSIRLRFENVPFDTLLGWLSQLHTQYNLSTTAANIDMSASPGRVNCNLTLDRAGS